jgi:hypothetical protein
MIAIVWLFIHIMVWCIVVGLLYHALMAVVSVVPATTQPFARAIAIVLLCLIAIMLLTGEIGLFDAPWRYSAHRGW